MYELNQLAFLSYPLASKPTTWVDALLLVTMDAMCRGGEYAQRRYDDAIATAQAVYGVDAPCYLVDPYTFSELSDIHKSHYGVRYRGSASRAMALLMIDQISARMDEEIEAERVADQQEREALAKRSFGDGAQTTAIALAFASAQAI